MKFIKEHPSLITILCAIVIIIMVSAALFATNQGSFQCELEERISSWDEWKWVLDKVITALIVLGAALWAQGVFNENARKRENRERRLNGIQSMIVLNQELAQEFIHMEGKYEALRKSYSRMLLTFNQIYSLDQTLEFNLNEVLVTIDKYLDKVSEALSKMEDGIMEGEAIPFPPELRSGSADLIRDLNHSLRSKFQEIESHH